MSETTPLNPATLRNPELSGALALAAIPASPTAAAIAANTASDVRCELTDYERDCNKSALYNVNDLESAAAVGLTLAEIARDGPLTLKPALALLARVPGAVLTRSGVRMGGLLADVRINHIIGELSALLTCQRDGEISVTKEVAADAQRVLEYLAAGVSIASSEIYSLVLYAGRTSECR